MQTLYFASSNEDKLKIARAACKKAQVPLEQVIIDINEIQGEEAEAIVKAKARAAFEILQKPVMVSDDTWSIPSLNGFPGAYMKSINHWFSTNDFLRLLDGIKQRDAYLFQYLAYYDGVEVTMFSNTLHGTILNEDRGTENDIPWRSIISMDGDGGLSLSEVMRQKDGTTIHKDRPDVWQEAATWYKAKYS